MIQRIYLGGESQTLKIGVQTASKQNIRIRVSDADQINTVLTDRHNMVEGIQYFFVRMPKAPVNALVEVFNEATGPQKYNDRFLFVKEGIWRQSLERKLAVIDVDDPYVKAFMKLGQDFCYHAGHLKPGEYSSPGNKVELIYMPAILDQHGKEVNTPAQTGEVTGEIEISQRKFQQYTVPMRFVILCHEFAHYYLNRDMYNEMEADLQGLNIYLGLGYPRYEAYEAFFNVFMGMDTTLNRTRLKKIEWYIDHFEDINTVMLYNDKRA